MNDEKKLSAAKEAIKYIKDGMVIGIGTGSTVKPFIDLLNREVTENGLKISAIPTSDASKDALHKSIKVLDNDLSVTSDLSIDGADKISRDFYLIKGGGGALLREKYVALNTKVNITIADDSKIVPSLRDHPLPIEIVPFGYLHTIKGLVNKGFTGSLRKKDGSTFITDGGNYIYDIDLKEPISDPENMHYTLKGLTGVIETGLFLRTSEIIIIGKNKESVEVWKKEATNE